jgi:hypothetical protein
VPGAGREQAALRAGRRLVISSGFYGACQCLAGIEGIDPLWCLAAYQGVLPAGRSRSP